MQRIIKKHIQFAACMCSIFSLSLVSRAQKPELFVQTGHTGQVFTVAISSDGKSLASGGMDYTIKLWDMATGTQLRSLEGHSNGISSLAFSPDGKTLASGSYDTTIKMWDVLTGTQLRSLEGHSDAVLSVAFSPDGKSLASGSLDKTIKLWDVATGTQLQSLEGHSDRVNSVAFSPDGKTLVSGSYDKTIKIWDVAKGAQLQTLGVSDSLVYSVAFSPDGRKLASSGSGGSIKMWDVATGTQLRSLVEDLSSILSIAFSPDGKQLAGGSIDSSIKLWDVATGTQLRSLQAYHYGVDIVAFSPDGKTLASVSTGKAIRLWDLATGTLLRTLEGWFPWDVTKGTMKRSFKGHPTVRSIAYSPDGKTLASGSFDNSIKLWDVATGTQLRSFEGHSDRVTSVAFSLDGKILASGSNDKTIKLWDVATGTKLRSLEGHSDLVFSVAFSPDGKTLASVSYDQSTKLWDVETGTQLHSLKGHAIAIVSITAGSDDKTLTSVDNRETIKLRDVSTGKQLRSFEGHTDTVLSVAVSPDGKLLASSSRDNTIRLWDVTTGTQLHSFDGPGTATSSVAFSPDGKTLVSSNSDGKTKLWNTRSGRELASLIAVDERDWIVVTPDGLFDGSPAAWSKIIWRFDNNTFNYALVEAFFSDFYYPGLLADIFAGKHPKAPTDISQKDRRQPQVKLTQADAHRDTTLTTHNVAVKIDISELGADKDHNAGSGAQDVRLFRNGSLVKVWRGDVLKGQISVMLEATIPIIGGENRLTAYAFNHDNIKSSDATLVINGADSLKRQGTAYVLAVGVNTYSNTNYNLKYAVSDAEDFSAEIKRQQDTLKNYGRVEVIPLNDKDATKANILSTLSQLATRAQPEDAVIVYFSGHGSAAQKRFYLIPYDLGYQGPRTKLSVADLKTILDHSISDRELEGAFEKIDAGQLLMVIDACNSGQALDSEEKRRGPMNSKGLAQLAYEKGMYILTAAQSYQAAWEASRLGHGFLTYALIEEGLKQGTADREPKDNQIVLREWFDYATERVPRLQEDKLNETLESKDQQRKALEFVFLEGDEAIKDPEKRSIQRPRVFYRREADSVPLIVARPEAVSPRE